MPTSKYSYEFKKKCVELYRQNLELPTPNTISRNNFRGIVSYWSCLVEAKGLEVLKPRIKNIGIGIPRKSFAWLIKFSLGAV